MNKEIKSLNFKEIELQDRETIIKYLQQDTFMISDISFGNLFIWRLARKIEFAILYDCLIIKTTYPNKNPFLFFPIGAGDKQRCIKVLKHYFDNLQCPLEFHSLEKYNLDFLANIFPNHIQSFLNRDRSDYVYLVSNLIQLSGRKYHKKKNHLNKFFEEYQGFTFEEIGVSNLSELQATWQEWDNAGDNEGLKNESRGIFNVFEHYNELGLKGGLLRFNSKIIAFSFGEILFQELCIIHIEKADIRYRGAYQAMNQQLLLHCFNDIQYVNREEDLGIEGLRKAKMSYHPDILIEKYEAKIL